MTDNQVKKNGWSWREGLIAILLYICSAAINTLLANKWFPSTLIIYILIATLVQFLIGMKRDTDSTNFGQNVGLTVYGFLPFCSSRPFILMMGWALVMSVSISTGYILGWLLRRSMSRSLEN